MAQFIVKLNTVDDNVQTLEFPIKAEWLSEALADTDVRTAAGQSPGSLAVRVYRTGPDIIVSGHAKATLVVDCSRCLEDVPIEVSAEVQLVMSHASDAQGEDAEVSEEDLGREFFTGDELVFDAIVRDHLLLELPMQPVCVDPPCPEWVKDYLTTADEAAAQDAESGPDPRLAALQGLADKLKPKS